MKFLSIGDIHGRTNWKEADFSSHDKVIFIGDYTDSFTAGNRTILENLMEIMQLKKDYPEKFELLLGNHDIQYMFHPDFRCSGFRPEMLPDLKILFNENKEIFRIAYQYKNYLWTHAGVSSKWYKRYHEHLSMTENEMLADKLNEISQTHLNYILHEVGPQRGGLRDNAGGPTWADINETRAGIIPGYHQIAGHTPQKQIVTYRKILDKTYSDRSITLIDVLETVLEFHSIEI